METNDSSELGMEASDHLDTIEMFGSELSGMLQFFDRIGYTDILTIQKCCYHYTLYHFYSSLSNKYKKYGRPDISFEYNRKSNNEKDQYFKLRDDIISTVQYDDYYLDRYYNTDHEDRCREEEVYLGEGVNVAKFPARVISNKFYTLNGSLEIFKSYYHKYYDTLNDLSPEEQQHL